MLAAIKRHDERHHVLVGDFNTLAPDERLDVSRLPRRLRLLGLVERRPDPMADDRHHAGSWAMSMASALLYPSDPGLTFPTWDPHVRLDYVFIPKPFAERLAACEVVTDGDCVRAASDHFPVRAEVQSDKTCKAGNVLRARCGGWD